MGQVGNFRCWVALFPRLQKKDWTRVGLTWIPTLFSDVIYDLKMVFGDKHILYQQIEFNCIESVPI